ncbi:MAG: transposase [Isosphaeraceae bacterium]
MRGTNKRYPAAFKARVALEAAQQTRTPAELSGGYQVHSAQISHWKKQLLDGIESNFRDGRRRDHDESQAIQAEFYEQIGRLKIGPSGPPSGVHYTSGRSSRVSSSLSIF